MRKLMWFTMGFGVSCALGAWLAPGLWSLVLGAVFLLLYGTLSVLRHRHMALAVGALAALGMAVGILWFCVYDGILLQPARLVDGATRTVELQVRDYPTPTDYGVSVDGRITLEGRNYKCRLYLTEPEELPEPGDRLTVSARLRLTTDGGIHEPTWHRTNGIFLLAYAREDAAITKGEPGLSCLPARIRRSIRTLIHELFPEDTRGFALALLLGDKSQLSYTQRNQLALAGMSHIVAVSGMHLTMAFGLLQILLLRRRIPTCLLGIPAVVLLAAVAGFTPSVNRSAIMVCLSLLAQLLYRDYDPPLALSFGALVLMAVNPLVAASVGFLLSVGAVAGIFCFTGPLSHWLQEKLPKGKLAKPMGHLSRSVATTMGATVFTAPVGAAAFGTVSLVSPLTNLLSLWAVELVFCGEILACVLGLFAPAVGKGVAWLISWFIRYVLAVGSFFGELPLSVLYTSCNPYGVAWAIFALVLLGLFLLGRYQGKRLFVAGISLGLVLSMLLPALESLREDIRVTVLDVGQGQSVVLQSENRVFLVDCGGDQGEGAGETAARYLLTHGITQLDGLILTHFDDDHISGVIHLTTRIPVTAVYYPNQEEGMACLQALDEITHKVCVTQDIKLTWNQTELYIFAPMSGGSSNESGLSVLFSREKYDTLITGDMGLVQERQLVKYHSLPDVELLVAGHHGSKYSTGEILLDAVTPEVLAISVGDNSYGHPAQAVLDRAMERGIYVRRTDLEGTLIFRGS